MPQISKPPYIQALVSQSAMETLHMCILDRLSWLDVDQFDSISKLLCEEMARDYFAAAVNLNLFQLAEYRDDMIKR
jgi:hypothetical protein